MFLRFATKLPTWICSFFWQTLFWYFITTRFHSFTGGHIPSVCDYEFLGNLFTNIFTDRIRLLTFLSSVMSHSVAISVSNTKKKTFANSFTDRICMSKKIFSLEIYRQIYLVGDSVTYWQIYIVGKVVGECLKYRPKISVYKFIGLCGRYCQIPMD